MSASIPNRIEPSGSPALATLRPTLLEIGNSSEFIAELRAGSACRHHCSSVSLLSLRLRRRPAAGR
ncbi:MAG: hypothetical protein F2840_13285 [Actinobacteria bacterium]|nr:hypothetical protein [Actinomycetota bacterium]